MSRTIFEKIIAGEIPSEIVYQDDLVVAFRDVNPKAPVHVLIVPRKPIPRIAEATADDHQLLGHLLLKAAEVAAKLGLKQSGYRLVINNGQTLRMQILPDEYQSRVGTAARELVRRQQGATRRTLDLLDAAIGAPAFSRRAA